MHEEKKRHRTSTELGERWKIEYGDVEEIVQTGRERQTLLRCGTDSGPRFRMLY